MSSVDRRRTSEQHPPNQPDPPGMDLLRQLAGSQARLTEAGVQGHRRHAIQTYRDPAGNVTHSVETVEEIVSPYFHITSQNYE